MKKKILSLALCLAVFFSFTVPAFALTPGVDSAVADQVHQGGDADTFANDMPFATYRIYPSYLRVGGSYQIGFTAYDVRIKNRDYYSNASMDNNNAVNAIIFDDIIEPGEKVTMNDKVFDLTFKGAAIDAAGNSHNVTLTFSNITIQNFSGETTGSTPRTAKSVTLLAGAISACSLMFDKTFTKEEIEAGQTLEEIKSHNFYQGGVSMTVTMTIADTDPAIPGKLNISFTDLDTGSRDMKGVSPNTPTTYDGRYSERVEIDSDYIVSKAFITRAAGTSSSDLKNLLYVSQGTSGLLFRGTAVTTPTAANNNTESIYSGFAIQVTPENTIKWAGGQCGTTLYGGTSTIAIRPLTKLYDNENSKVSDTWTVSDKGGSISMTESADDSVISWSEEDIKYGTQKYVTRFYTNLKPTTFAVGAKEGFTLTGMTYSSKYGSEDPTGETDGTAVTTSLLKELSNNKINHVLEKGNGAHYVAAFYMPIVSSITIHKQDQDGNPMAGVEFTAEGTSSVHGAFRITAVTDGDGNAEISGIPYGTSADDYRLTEEVPEGYLPDGENPIIFHFSESVQNFTITNNKTYHVDYEWTGDIPEGVELPGSEGGYDWHDNPNPDGTYDEDTKIPGEKDGVPGTYVFSGWDASEDPDLTEDGMEGDVTYKGVWTFIPDKYEVDYEWTGDVPEGVELPGSEGGYDWHDDPNPDGTYDEDTKIPGEKDGVPGTYVFNGWDASGDPDLTEDGMEGDVTYKGVWTFIPDKYEVDYEWTGDVPEGAELPGSEGGYDWHDNPNPDGTYDEDTKIPGEKDGVPGTYVFSGWDASEDPDLTEEGMEGNVTYKGVWTFVPDEYKVDYEWTGDIPEGVELPGSEGGYDWHDDPNPDMDTTYDEDTKIPGEKDGVPGTYVFSGWDASEDPDLTEEGMEGNVTYKGTWTFIPDEYEVDYEWSGDVPEDAELPGGKGGYDWHDNPNPDKTYGENTKIRGTKDGVPGTYVFSGWDASEDPDLTEDGMEGNVTYKGTWTFIPDEVPPVAPETGVSGNMHLCIALFVVSGCIFAIAAGYGRKKKRA